MKNTNHTLVVLSGLKESVTSDGYVELLRSPSLARHSVIPAPYQVRGKLQRESRLCPCEGREPLRIGFLFSQETLDSPYQVRGRPGQAKNDKAGKCLFNNRLIYRFREKA